MTLASWSGVAPVSTSPALVIAHQVPPAAVKPWYPPSDHASSSSASARSGSTANGPRGGAPARPAAAALP
jgi:hypothetical protein